MKLRILVGIIIFLLTFNIVLADFNVELIVNPEEIWLKDSQTHIYQDPIVNAQVLCKLNGTDITNNSTISIYLYDSSDNLKRSASTNLIDFSIENSWDYGIYKIKATCNYGNFSNTTEKQIVVHKLELYLTENNLTSYIGDTLVVPITFKIDDDIEQFGLANYDFSLNNRKINIGPNNLELNGYILEIKAPIDLDFSEGYWDFDLKITYEDEIIEVSKKNYVYLEPPLKIITRDKDISCKANQICQKILNIVVYYYGLGSLDDFDENNFVIGIFKNNDLVDTADITNVNCKSSTRSCSLDITIPSLSPGDYILSIKAFKEEYESTNIIPLTSYLSLEGEIIDASGKGVSLSIILKNKKTGKIITTNSIGGGYSLNIVPGTYDFSADFGGGTLLVDIHNVTFESENISYGSNINFDSFISTSPIEGVHVTKVIVFEFGYNFKDAVLWIPYSDSNVINEDNLRVYRCIKWNFGRRTCNGEWELINSKTDVIRNIIEIHTNKFGAFVLGEQKFLHFYTIAAGKSIAYLGDTIPVEGKVLDSDGLEVQGATITLTVENQTSTTTTLSDGSFLGYITMPYKEGSFEIEAKVEKEPYVSATKKMIVKTTRKKEISITLPNTASVNLDKNGLLELVVMNTGQVNLTDIYLLITGLSVKNYNLVPAQIEKLEPGENKKIKMNVYISSDDCKEQKCKQYYLIGVTVKAKTEGNEEISGGGSFTLELKQPTIESETSNNIFDGISGLFTLPSNLSTNIINYLLGGIILILIILIIRKKKGTQVYGGNYNYKRMNLPRNNIVSSMNTIKKQIRDRR